ncbi:MULTISPECIES: hypothetical protein [Streptomyces]|uniref:Uncharacterized protein n=1 Tax=Streptomyces fimbriatus TaxID=68197 RepID=A0ABW0DIP6_STRFI
MELVSGRVDGRAGAEGLTGLRGTGGFTYRHGETKVPHTFAYGLEWASGADSRKCVARRNRLCVQWSSLRARRAVPP